MKKKTLLTITGGVIVTMAVISQLSFGFLTDNDYYGGEPDFEMMDKLDKTENNRNIDSVPSVEQTEFDENGNWEDDTVQRVIHHLSHQKITADQKWGGILVTKERLDTLSFIIEKNKDDLEYYNVYRDILDKWITGDFSQADKDHNKIWKLQNGTIGKATGLASKEQEKEFVENTFETE